MTEISALSPLGITILLLMVVVPVLLAIMISSFILWCYEGDHCVWYGMRDRLDDAIDWVKSGGKSRKKRLPGATPPQQPVPPATGGADAGAAGEITSRHGEDKPKISLEKIRYILPPPGKGDGLPRIEWVRQAGRTHIRILSQQHCFLRASFPSETDDSDLDWNQSQVGHFDPSDITFGCHLDGLDIAFNGTHTGVFYNGIPGVSGCLDLHFHPNKAHLETYVVAPQGKHHAGDTERAADDGSTYRDPHGDVGKVHHADHTKQPSTGRNDGLAHAQGHKD